MTRLSRNLLILIISACALVFSVGSGAALAQVNPALSWTSQQQISGSGTSAGPALAVFNGRLYGMWVGSQSDSGVYWASASG